MKSWLILTFYLCLFAGQAQAVFLDKFEQCLLARIAISPDITTIGEVNDYCKRQVKNEINVANSAIEQRYLMEKEEDNNPFSLLPHRPNYIILSNNLASTNERIFNDAFPERTIDLQPLETKFQVSIKVPIARELFNKADLFVAYTNRSFWQQFNKENSSPFRESNHEPELWLSFKNNGDLFGFRNRIIRAGISHQSNGKSDLLSRSWNRIYADFIFEREKLFFSFKPWFRVPESDDNDDNPDIDEYLGNFELSGLYKEGKHSFDILLRNNLRFGDNRGALQLGWSFPLTQNIKGYLQWFNGYGESLIDYDAYSNSIGLGVQLTDWL